MLSTNPFEPLDGDKLHEECGVFGIWGADNAASFVALGLHALQHRGQEAAGVTSYDGAHFHSHRAMGHVAGNFDKTPDFPTFTDGHYEMQLCEAIERSAREQAWVKIK